MEGVERSPCEHQDGVGFMGTYKVIRRIAEGRFGCVSAASKISTGEQVAIKKIHGRRPPPGFAYDPWSKSGAREIEVLSTVKHQHVVALLDHWVAPGASSTLLVYEYVAWDLSTVLERRNPMDEGQVKAVLQMLLLGLEYLHFQKVMHRDLKPANLLLHGSTGTLKIADFGSARFIPALGAGIGSSVRAEGGCDLLVTRDVVEDEALTREVCTRWYKSPEMLFGSVDYDMSVDLWAVGCVFGDLLAAQGQALFPGNSDLEQLCCIFQALGTPREDEWPEVRKLPDYAKVEFTVRSPQPLDFGCQRSPHASSLILQFLQLCPYRRISASAALKEELFNVFPMAVQPGCLVEGLESLAMRGADRGLLSDNRPLTPLCESNYGSEDSGLGVPGADFEPLEIETTTCGLWDHVALGGELEQRGRAEEQVVDDFTSEPAERPRHRTPSPPRAGVVHHFKVRP